MKKQMDKDDEAMRIEIKKEKRRQRMQKKKKKGGPGGRRRMLGGASTYLSRDKNKSYRKKLDEAGDY